MPPRNRNFNSSWESDREKPDSPRRLCPTSGKRMYANEREAKSTAAHQLSREQSPPPHLKIYLCPYCRAYHLTSKDQ
jgi:hypothetical protein